jgi:hypothetical protein
MVKKNVYFKRDIKMPKIKKQWRFVFFLVFFSVMALIIPPTVSAGGGLENPPCNNPEGGL